MLTYGYWRRKFGGDRAVIGKTITVDGKLAPDHRRAAAGFPFSKTRLTWP